MLFIWTCMRFVYKYYLFKYKENCAKVIYNNNKIFLYIYKYILYRVSTYSLFHKVFVFYNSFYSFFSIFLIVFIYQYIKFCIPNATHIQ